MQKEKPTVEDLVKIFQDNKWTPTPGNDGCRYNAYKTRKCCAVPAVVKYYDPEWVPSIEKVAPFYDTSFYDKIREIINNVDLRDLYIGFDGVEPNKAYIKYESILKSYWYKLGKELRERLIK